MGELKSIRDINSDLSSGMSVERATAGRHVFISILGLGQLTGSVQIFSLAINLKCEHMVSVRFVSPVLQGQAEIVCLGGVLMIVDVVA